MRHWSVRTIAVCCCLAASIILAWSSAWCGHLCQTRPFLERRMQGSPVSPGTSARTPKHYFSLDLVALGPLSFMQSWKYHEAVGTAVYSQCEQLFDSSWQTGRPFFERWMQGSPVSSGTPARTPRQCCWAPYVNVSRHTVTRDHPWPALYSLENVTKRVFSFCGATISVPSCTFYIVVSSPCEHIFHSSWQRRESFGLDLNIQKSHKLYNKHYPDKSW